VKSERKKGGKESGTDFSFEMLYDAFRFAHLLVSIGE
jgi:hypothetical protein